MNSDKITRRDVDQLSAQILINFGLINAAALAGTFSDIKFLGNMESARSVFSFGLAMAVLSQIIWYFDAVLEYTLDGKGVFDRAWENKILNFISGITIIGSGCFSGGCIVYGCLMIVGIDDALFKTWLLLGVPFAALFYIAYRCSHKIE